MLLQRGSTRLVDTFTFAASARQTMDIQVPAKYMQRIWVWLRGTLTISAVTVPGTIHTDGPANLITTLELLVDGKLQKIGSGPSFFRIAQWYDQTGGRNAGLTSPNAGVYTFEALIPLMFEAASSVSPIDTLIDGRMVTAITLNLTWGTTASLILGNTSTLALTATTAEIYMQDTDPFPLDSPLWTMRESEITQTGVLTATETRIPVPFNPGSIIRALQLRAIDGTDLSDAIINTISLRLNGEEWPLRALEDDFQQALQLHNFGRDLVQPGYYHLELNENGRIATTGLGANPDVQLNDVDLILDTTVGAGATSIVVHVVEHVPPDAAALAAAGFEQVEQPEFEEEL